MSNDTATLKIGRWTYPVQVQGGKVVRNEKRDGSGAWVAVTDKQMTKADQDLLIRATGEVKEKPKSEDYDTLLKVYQHIFDSFSVHGYEELADQFGMRIGRAKAAVSRLIRFGLVTTYKNLDTTEGKFEIVIQSLITYDDISPYEAEQNFHDAVPNDVKIPNPSTHGGVKGKQVNKPGKSTWKLGDKCPRGKHTLNEANRYRTPAGRFVCRDCRSEHPSVRARKAGA